MRIAVGGFEHETNTFAPARASFDDFAEADVWPALSRGDALFPAVAGINLPVTGFIDEASRQGHELVPLLWCSAVPSAQVTEDAYERIAAMLLEDLAAKGPFEAVYLDLHGAMVTEHLEDGEGELLRRVREVVGDLPVVASLDLHANVTAAMVKRVSAMVAFRTYPHVDMADTGRRAALELARQAASRSRTFKAFRKLPFLIPVHLGCTLQEPCRTLYRRVGELEGGAVTSLSLTAGFPLADVYDCGPAVLAYGSSEEAAEEAAGRLCDEVIAREGHFEARLYAPEEAVVAAMGNTKPGPVVLADTQDNPGGGGNSDTVGLLEALVRNRAKGAVLAILCDPEAAAEAHGAGEGASISIRLGAKSGYGGERPFEGDFVVERLADGRFTATGPMYRGSRARIGPMALLRLKAPGGVRVVVASRKFQAADKSIFRHVGIEPAEVPILALKSSVHFRADFEDIASDILLVEAPGPNLADSAKIPFRHLREGVRVAPLGPPFRRAARTIGAAPAAGS